MKNIAENFAKEILTLSSCANGLRLQSLITRPYPGFPLLLSDPSFNSVPGTILGVLTEQWGSVLIHLLPPVLVSMQAVHQVVTGTKLSITKITFLFCFL